MELCKFHVLTSKHLTFQMPNDVCFRMFCVCVGQCNNDWGHMGFSGSTESSEKLGHTPAWQPLAGDLVLLAHLPQFHRERIRGTLLTGF